MPDLTATEQAQFDKMVEAGATATMKSYDDAGVYSVVVGVPFKQWRAQAGLILHAAEVPALLHRVASLEERISSAIFECLAQLDNGTDDDVLSRVVGLLRGELV